MREVRTDPAGVSGVTEIVALAEQYRDLFVSYPQHDRPPRPEAPFDPGRDSEDDDDDRYHVLEAKLMPDELRRAILVGLCGTTRIDPDFYYQVNRYDRGDYVLPHRDTLEQGLYMLSESDVDGLVAQSPEGLVFLPDRAGTLVTHDPNAWHWVDPVEADVRYTLVTIPARPRVLDDEEETPA